MKISKNSNVSAATNTAGMVASADDTNVDIDYAEAIDHVKAAIDALSKFAKHDETAKSAIADLSVVLFKLK